MLDPKSDVNIGHLRA